MLTVSPVHSLVELHFWYSWLALQPEEECVFHVHWAALHHAAVVRAGKKQAVAFRLASEVLELPFCEQKTGLTCAALF